jgi:hypothetical protein
MADKQLNITLTEDEHRQFKLACINEGRTMQDVGRLVLLAFVASRPLSPLQWRALEDKAKSVLMQDPPDAGEGE